MPASSCDVRHASPPPGALLRHGRGCGRRGLEVQGRCPASRGASPSGRANPCPGPGSTRTVAYPGMATELDAPRRVPLLRAAGSCLRAAPSLAAPPKAAVPQPRVGRPAVRATPSPVGCGAALPLLPRDVCRGCGALSREVLWRSCRRGSRPQPLTVCLCLDARGCRTWPTGPSGSRRAGPDNDQQHGCHPFATSGLPCLSEEAARLAPRHSVTCGLRAALPLLPRDASIGVAAAVPAAAKHQGRSPGRPGAAASGEQIPASGPRLHARGGLSRHGHGGGRPTSRAVSCGLRGAAFELLRPWRSAKGCRASAEEEGALRRRTLSPVGCGPPCLFFCSSATFP